MLIPRALWLPVVILAVTALLGVLLQPVTRIVVATDDDRTLVCRRIAPDETVTLVFTHSMYGGEVRETWQPDGNRLARRAIETDNAAAAEYYATDGAVERTNGGFVVASSPLTIDTLRVRIDQVGAHRLRVDGDEIALAARIDDSAASSMTVRHTTLLQDMVAGCDA